MKYLKKINWKNVLISMLFITSALMILHDLFMVSIYSFISGKMLGWTMYGFISFWILVSVANYTFDYLLEQFKRVNRRNVC